MAYQDGRRCRLHRLLVCASGCHCTVLSLASALFCACRTTGKERQGTVKVQRGTQKATPPQRTAGTQKAAPATGTRRAGGSSSKPSSSGSSSSDQSYFNVTGYPFPLGPFLKRPTIRKDIVRGAIWGFEQPQSLGGSNVTTNIRMTVVKLQSGGLWVHAPIAPTRE